MVLKVVRTPHEEWDAGAVVAAFAGHGIVRALEHLPGAVLLEEVRPGIPLVDLVRQGRDDEATDALVRVIQEMAAAEPDTRGLVARSPGRATLRARGRREPLHP